MKCQNVKNKASGQRAPILDVLAFHAFRSLRGRQKESTGRDARWGRENPLCKFFLEYGQPTTVLKGKLHRYRNGNGVIHGGLLSWSKNSIHTVSGTEAIHGGLLSLSKNFIHTVSATEAIRGGLLSLSKNSIHTVSGTEAIHKGLLSLSKNFIHTVSETEAIHGGLLSPSKSS